MKYNIGDIVELTDGTQTEIRDVRQTHSGIIYGVGYPSLIVKTEEDIVRKIN